MATPDSHSSSSDNTLVSPSPLRCFSGAFVSGSISLVLYRLMTAIAQTFAAKPIVSDNVATVNIAAAVRTLVVGIVALGMGVFGIAALGLAALGIQLLIQRFTKSPNA